MNLSKYFNNSNNENFNNSICYKEEDINFNDEKSDLIDIYSEDRFIFSYSDIFPEKTKDNTDLLNKKRKLDRIKKSTIFEKQEKEEQEEKEEKKNNNVTNNKKSKGRKRKGENYDEEKEDIHSKFKQDNIMRKIKTTSFKYIRKALNNSLKYKTFQFYKLNKKFHEDLKADLNKELLNTKLRDIYSNLSFQYTKKNNSNIKLIEKIYREKKETETIKLLNMKFKDFLKDIIEKDLVNFLNEIKEKLIRNKTENIDKYMEHLKDLFLNYETWFDYKKSRNRKKLIILLNNN